MYSSGATTDDGNTASDSLLALACSGKAYVKGYEIEKISNTFIDVNKARDFQQLMLVLQHLRLVTLQRLQIFITHQT